MGCHGLVTHNLWTQLQQRPWLCKKVHSAVIFSVTYEKFLQHEEPSHHPDTGLIVQK